ncbi:MAG: carbohydrate ABC transporter permease [Eubacteriales bacterium]|nr:carbohydrate ABC transporter permease [Eubacteriales bacterium]
MKQSSLSKLLLHCFILLMCLLAIYPVYIMISGVFKTASEIALNPGGLPSSLSLKNFERLWSYNSGSILRSYGNALFVTFLHTALTIGLSSMAAFAFAKYRFRGSKWMFLFLMATMMIPMELGITPLYIMFSRIGWLNTYVVQIIPFSANVFAMFMIRQYMNSIDNALLESAIIDGASHLRTFTSIMFPCCKPVLGATALLVALSKFNDYLWPKIMVTDAAHTPIMVILPTMSEKTDIFVIPKELVMTGCAIVIIPLIILFICLQNVFMSSVTIGSVKG